MIAWAGLTDSPPREVFVTPRVSGVPPTPRAARGSRGRRGRGRRADQGRDDSVVEGFPVDDNSDALVKVVAVDGNVDPEHRHVDLELTSGRDANVVQVEGFVVSKDLAAVREQEKPERTLDREDQLGVEL